jgi:AraC family transcriptional regulator, positive regulator of tynA and feaB
MATVRRVIGWPGGGQETFMTSFHFNTAASKNAGRAWHDFIDEKFGLSSVNIGDEATFAGDIRCSPLGFLTLAQLRASRELSERSKAQVARARNENFVIVLLRAGKLEITQAGRECRLGPNMFTLFDCNVPYTFRHGGPTEVVDVIVPAGAMRARLKAPEACLAQPRCAASGLARVMADMLPSLAREAPRIPGKAADDCAREVADMMGVLFDSGGDDLPVGESAVRSAIYRRCAAFIENNLDDPRLGPANIAVAAGISVRYLHKIFRGSGESVGDHVRRLRLARSYEQLTDGRKTGLTIKEIAFRCGFKSPQHFSDAFRSHHGTSPTEARRTSLAAPSPVDDEG